MEENTIQNIIAEFEAKEEIKIPTRKLTQEENLLFYYMNNERSVTVTQEITLAEPIDFDKMQYALTLTIKRFPYFKVKVEKHGDSMCFVHNEKPIQLYHKYMERSVFNSENNNGFLFRFEVDGDKLYMNNAHLLTDGRGKLPLVQTLLTFYYGLMGIENTSNLHSRYLSFPEDINLEWENPFKHLPKEDIQVEMPKKEGKPCYRLQFEHDSKRRTFVHAIEVPVDDMMSYCKKVGGTPNTVIAAGLASAIAHCNQDFNEDENDINIGVIIDTKPALDTDLSSINAFAMAKLTFDKESTVLSQEEKHSQLKTSLRSQATPEMMMNDAKNLAAVASMILALPTVEERQAMANDIVTSAFKKEVTAAISYAGQSKLGDISSNVKSVMAIVESSIFDLLVEVNCLDNVFCITMMQSFDSVKYMFAMKRYLQELGMRYYDNGSRIISQVPFILK
ncbi:MAG: hypothetical protein HUJ97_02800 [Bacteroidales bacterium]|nr:hypothetical protein [Bacteroidales bacterium]